MKAISLLLLRMSTGIYLALWGIVRFSNTEMATSLSEKYYGGLINGELINTGLGLLQIAIGLLVALGLARTFSYAAQLVWYVVGIAPIMLYILDPLGKYFLEQSKLTFFPSTTLLFASVVIIAFREYDTLSIDSKLGKE